VQNVKPLKKVKSPEERERKKGTKRMCGVGKIVMKRGGEKIIVIEIETRCNRGKK
jgi:hypothetical protein